MHQQFLAAISVLPVKSVIDTVKYYEEKLGFVIEVLWENPAYGVVRCGNAIIEFGEGRQAHVGSGICIVKVKNADVIYDQWKANDVEFVGNYSDRDYGSKNFRIKYNNENILIIEQALVNSDELQHKNNVALK